MKLSISKQKREFLYANGHILAIGGPGSGKTTIALLKANEIIKNNLKPGQKVLFLSFARATIIRVQDKTKGLIEQNNEKLIEINTYHGFTWNLLKRHGYLLNKNYPFKLLPPPEAAAQLSYFDNDNNRNDEKIRLFNQQGIIHFDLFATLSSQLLSESKSLTSIIADTYPVIILDEFQDTNDEEWELIMTLAEKSNIVALADPNQRIYGFRGANPTRIDSFIKKYSPKFYDFSNENFRNNHTDINKFGDDVLNGTVHLNKYRNVEIQHYIPKNGVSKHLELKSKVLGTLKRLNKQKNEWSIAILVPTNQLMFEISDYLNTEQIFKNNQRMPKITHDVAFDSEGPILAGKLISGLLENNEYFKIIEDKLIINLSNHIRGRKGDKKVPKKSIEITKALENYINTNRPTGAKRKIIIKDCVTIVKKCQEFNFSGNPSDDWLIIRDFLLEAESEFIKQVAEDAKYLRILSKGNLLRRELGNLWKDTGNYQGATEIYEKVIMMEHFALNKNKWQGIKLMTIHKSKGKEFNEVIIYDGSKPQDKILYSNSFNNDLTQSKLKLRVAVTRGMEKVLILTPKNDICKLLCNNKI